MGRIYRTNITMYEIVAKRKDGTEVLVALLHSDKNIETARTHWLKWNNSKDYELEKNGSVKLYVKQK